MPLFRYRCPLCGNQTETFKKDPMCNHNQEEEGVPTPLMVMQKLLSAPAAKFLEPTNKEKGKSKLKDQEKILMARAKEDARLNDYHELTQNNDLEMAKKNGWIREDGTTRKRIDDK